MSQLSTIALLAAIPIVLYLLWQPLLRYLTPKGLPDVPGLPDPKPIWGDALEVGRKLKETGGFGGFTDWLTKAYGPIVALKLLNRNFIVISDWPTIEWVLTSPRFDRDADQIDRLKVILPKAQIALPTNTMWKHHRRILGPAMSSKNLSQATPKANESISEFLQVWRLKSKLANGKAFDARVDLENATMDAICGIAFGESWGCTREAVTQLATDHMVTVGDVGERVFTTLRPPVAESMWYVFGTVPMHAAIPKLSHFITRMGSAWRLHHGRLEGYLRQRLAESRAQSKEKGAEVALETCTNTLDMMTARELRGSDRMPDDEIIDEIFQYLVAGTETSAATLEWAVKFLTNNPDAQRRLRAETQRLLPELDDRAPTFEDLNAEKLPYLEAVVFEVNRLARVASGYGRVALEDVTILGHRIPKGTSILTPAYINWEDRAHATWSPSPSPTSSVTSDVSDSDDDVAVKREESLASRRGDIGARKVGYWAANTGKEFRPERWLDPDGRFNVNAGPSVPFSLGQRGCFGRNLALLELRLFLVQMNREFFFAPVTEAQNVFDRLEIIATRPVQCLIRPVAWHSPEAKGR